MAKPEGAQAPPTPEGHYTLRLSETPHTGSLQKYPSYKTILGSFPNSWLTKGSRDSKENLNKRKNT